MLTDRCLLLVFCLATDTGFCRDHNSYPLRFSASSHRAATCTKLDESLRTYICVKCEKPPSLNPCLPTKAKKASQLSQRLIQTSIINRCSFNRPVSPLRFTEHKTFRCSLLLNLQAVCPTNSTGMSPNRSPLHYSASEPKEMTAPPASRQSISQYSPAILYNGLSHQHPLHPSSHRAQLAEQLSCQSGRGSLPFRNPRPPTFRH